MTDLSAKARLGRMDALSALSIRRRRSPDCGRAVPQPRRMPALFGAMRARVEALSC